MQYDQLKKFWKLSKKFGSRKSHFTRYKIQKFSNDTMKTNFVSSLRSKHHMSSFEREFDSHGLVNYFSYPHHGQKVCEKNFRALWRQKLASKMRKVRKFDMVGWAWKFKIYHVLHVFDSSLRLKLCMNLIQRALDTSGLVVYFSYSH